MAIQNVSDMSMGDLRAFVESIVREHLGSPHAYSYQQQGSRPVEEVLESMRANLWTPPAGAKSSLEILREDRDR